MFVLFACNMFRQLLVFIKFHVCFSVICDTCFFVNSVKTFNVFLEDVS
jgi:hypothetical protein